MSDEPPEPPQPDDCCGSGCCPCVWDTYYARLERYEATRKHIKQPSVNPRSVPSQSAQPWQVTFRIVDDEELIDLNPAAEGRDELDALDVLRKNGYSFSTIAPVREHTPRAESSALRTLRLDGLPWPDATVSSTVFVYAPNSDEMVWSILRRLNLMKPIDNPVNADASFAVQLMPSAFSPTPLPSWLPTWPMRSFTLFKYFLDLSSTAWIKPDFFSMLAQHCTAKEDVEWATLKGAATWSVFKSDLDTSLYNLDEILKRLPSARPPLAKLVEKLSPLRPRTFSVAAASATETTGVELCIRPVVKRREVPPLLPKDRTLFRGHVTSALVDAELSPGTGVFVRPNAAVSTLPFVENVLHGRAAGVVFAGGSGIAPARFLMSRRPTLAAGFAPLTCYWVTRCADDLLALPTDWSTRDGVQLHSLVGRDALQAALANSDGLSAVWDVLRPGGQGAVIACGPSAFMQEVRTHVLRALDVGLGGGAAGSLPLGGMSAQEYLDSLLERGRFWCESWTTKDLPPLQVTRRMARSPREGEDLDGDLSQPQDAVPATAEALDDSDGDDDDGNIVLMSSDGDEFRLTRHVAMSSGLLRMMLEDDETNVVPLPQISSSILGLVVKFMKHHAIHPMRPIEKPLRGRLEDNISEWDKAFLVTDVLKDCEDDRHDDLTGLVLAANYLDMRDLLDFACAAVASLIKGKNPQQIRQIFHIENDFTPEETAAIQAENQWAEEA